MIYLFFFHFLGRTVTSLCLSRISCQFDILISTANDHEDIKIIYFLSIEKLFILKAYD